jgi:hypothetical protein
MYLSGQLGTAQLGLAQLGQFKRSFSLSLDASSTSPVAVVATALSTGGAVSGGTPTLHVDGSNTNPVAVTATALSAGAKLNTPGLAARPVRGGFWWWWQESEFALNLIDDMLGRSEGEK